MRAMDAADEAMLEAAWDAVDRDWDDLEAHSRLLVLADRLDALAWVAARYRSQASEARQERARAQAARIVSLAITKMAQTRTPRSEQTHSVVLVARVLAFVFLLSAFVFAGLALFDCGRPRVRDTLRIEEQARPHAARLQSP